MESVFITGFFYLYRFFAGVNIMIKTKEGHRILQVHLPLDLHLKLSEAGFKLQVTKSEITRIALEGFLKNKGFNLEN